MEDELTCEKTILRKKFMEARASEPKTEARAADAAIASHILSSNFYKDAKSVFVFIGVGDEVDTAPVIQKAFRDGKTVFMPRTKEGRMMEAVAIYAEEFFERSGAMWPRRNGIPEPPDDLPAADISEPGLVIVPSLALDLMGYRLGYGGGYYDRYIKIAREQKTRPLFVAVQRALYVRSEALPLEPFDEAVDLIVTENGVIIPFS